MFTSTRQLVLEAKMDFILGVISFVLLVLAVAITCILCTCCLTCLCMKCFGGKAAFRRRCCRQRARCALNKPQCQNTNSIEMQAVGKDTEPAVQPQQPYAYFVLSPYTLPQDNSEQTFVMPSAPQDTSV